MVRMFKFVFFFTARKYVAKEYMSKLDLHKNSTVRVLRKLPRTVAMLIYQCQRTALVIYGLKLLV